ncbi:hypothetical protein JCM19275_107 [Nonlabens ulvanivorans]|uniref:Uncharacterized protein n=1 Tax=Nonlabens ulvanivorans TaxID=906888 RepID=A0A090WI31_NONUL|nr:hypothetical protein JCM19275_107 [Nonlabens ulvanivorans]
MLFGFLAFAQNPEISLKSNENGHVLLVENELYYQWDELGLFSYWHQF